MARCQTHRYRRSQRLYRPPHLDVRALIGVHDYRDMVDLTGIHGYYTLLAMEMNVARFEPKGGMPRLPRFPD